MSGRHSEKIVRVDLRIPKKIYERIQAIAVTRYDAKIHHRSGKPEVSPTILELIKRGLTQVEEELSDNEESLSAEELEDLIEQIEALDSRLTAVEHKLSSGVKITAPESSSETEGKGLNDLELGKLLGVSNMILRDYRVKGKITGGQALAKFLEEQWVIKEGLWFRKKLTERRSE